MLKKPYIIAEVAQAHEGSLGLALSYIDALAEIGVDAVKFQLHLADAESTLNEEFRINHSGQDPTRFAYWKRIEFTQSEWEQIINHCSDLNIDFLCSPFSKPAVDFLISVGINTWKVGSGEVFEGGVLDHLLTCNPKFLIVSTGMSSMSEIHQLYDKILKYREPHSFALMHCRSIYPTPINDISLSTIPLLKKRFNCHIGHSDHSANINVALASIAYGVDIYEGHVVFDKRMYGPDVSSSLTLDEFKSLTSFARDWSLLTSQAPTDPASVGYFDQMRNLFTKSLALSHPLKAGHRLSHSDFTFKKPGTGIPPSCINDYIGRTLRHDTPCDRLLLDSDFH